jgi:sRNA-binding regulator protein Hfq
VIQKEQIMKEQYDEFYQRMNSMKFLKECRAGRAYKLVSIRTGAFLHGKVRGKEQFWILEHMEERKEKLFKHQDA